MKPYDVLKITQPKCSTLVIIVLAFFQDRSFGITPEPADHRTNTAAATLTTAPGGDAKPFNSVKLF